MSRDETHIVRGYLPGAIGRIAELHAVHYHAHWQFGAFFEAGVAAGLAEFMGRYDAEHDALWLLLHDDRIHGSIAIDRPHEPGGEAHLRWFIVDDGMRGTGFGSRLLATAIHFCRERGYGGIYLDTFQGLHAARHLYEQAGFRLTAERTGTSFGRELREQRLTLSLT